jgi:hypothetical protein
MSRSPTEAATGLAVERAPNVQKDLRLDDDRHLKVLIESLVRAGCSEHEIVDAVNRARDR